MERLLDVSVPPLALQSNQGGYRLTHGPPGFAYLTSTLPYLLFSVLRI